MIIPTNYVYKNSAPVFTALIADDSGEMLTTNNCTRILLNIEHTDQFGNDYVPVPQFVDVEIPLDYCLQVFEESFQLKNFRHICEVYTTGNPISAFSETNGYYRVEYSFDWNDNEGNKKIPVKLVYFVKVV
jgi:hypothetical protein